jgi:hypothetical protein
LKKLQLQHNDLEIISGGDSGFIYKITAYYIIYQYKISMWALDGALFQKAIHPSPRLFNLFKATCNLSEKGAVVYREHLFLKKF